ncbi:hypothetical protein ES702_06828 [subsurface metagenome]
MGIKLGKILGTVGGTIADILPGGGIIKSILKGAGSLLLRKAAKKIGIPDSTMEAIFNEAEQMFLERKEIRESFLKEQEAERKFLLESEGRYSELSKTEKVWRTLMRPVLTVSVVGTFILVIWINVASQVFSFKAVVVPGEITMFSKWIVAFWFCSRGAEKLFNILNGRSAND